MGSISTTIKNRTSPDKGGEYKQPWSYLINAKIDAVSFDETDHQKITGLTFVTEDGQRLWLSVNVEVSPKWYISFH